MLRKFIGCHGLDVLKTCLDAHIQQKTIVRHQILQVLKSLPISSKNGVLKLEEIIQTMTDTTVFGDYTAQLASELLESWKDLQMVYKIPKKSVDMIKSESLDSRPEKKQKVDEPLDWKAQLTPSIYQVAMNRSSKYQGANNIFSGDKSDSGDKVGRRDSIGSFSRQESNSSFQRQESSGSFQKQDSNGWSKESSSGRTKESSSGWKKEPSSGWGKQDSNPRDRRNAPAWEKRDNREKRDKIPENKLDQNEKPLEKKPSPILKPNWIQCKEEQAVYYRNMVTLERTTIPPIQSPPRPAIINGISEDDMRKMIQMADQAVKQHREKEKEPKEQPKDSDQVQLVKQQVHSLTVDSTGSCKANEQVQGQSEGRKVQRACQSGTRFDNSSQTLFWRNSSARVKC
ncbi:hypothetical protein EDD86DRAFT_54051 [Gorgonomyces haynaldii]|nr:hypothetical protein EDD86DRAFT_54051 [Gorgonomyces haynaldii]